MQTHLNMSPCSDGICWLQLLLPLHEVIVQVIRHGLPKLRKKLIGHPSILPACQIYATNMARPKWHNSFYTNIAQNQEISSRVLLFSRFDFDLSFSTSLNPQIISIKKLLVHKKTHHQPTFKKSHNLSNMRNHNPRCFDPSRPYGPYEWIVSFTSTSWVSSSRSTWEDDFGRQLHGPKVKNIMPIPEIQFM